MDDLTLHVANFAIQAGIAASITVIKRLCDRIESSLNDAQLHKLLRNADDELETLGPVDKFIDA